ncbi:hypothetical protein EBU71_03140 [bacterium]|nr:hypothetical protein [Candidatus Elulimicrobium humile]
MQVGTLSLCACQNSISYDTIFITYSAFGSCFQSCEGTCSNYTGTAEGSGTLNYIPCYNIGGASALLNFVTSQEIDICACGNGMSPSLQNSPEYSGPTYSGSISWDPVGNCECFTTTTSTTTSNEPNIWTMYGCPLGCGFEPDPPFNQLRGCFFDSTTIQTSTVSVWTQPPYSSPSLFTIGMTFSSTSDLSILWSSTSYLSFTNSIVSGSGIIYQLDGSYALVATYSIGEGCS